MNKTTIIESITQELKALGIEPEIQINSDIRIRTTLLDYKRKLEFSGDALLDDTKKTIYYFESTRDNAFNLFFSPGGDELVQFKYTWPRKIRNLQKLPDGSTKEYEIFQSDIIECFKRVAAANGWKVKTTWSIKSAIYPTK